MLLGQERVGGDDMPRTWLPWLVLGLAVLVVVSGLLFVLTKRMLRQEPYASFMHLRTKGKIRFFRALLGDRRIPFPVKIIPVLTVLYLASPLDLVPDFIPVLGYMDDVGIVVLALAAVLRFRPRPVVDELLLKAAQAP